MSPQCSFSMDIDKKFWKLVNNIKYQPPWLEIIGCQEKGRFPNVLSHKLPVCHRAAVAGGKPHLNISAHPTTAHFWLFITSSFHDFRLLMSTKSVGKWWSLVRKTLNILFIVSKVLHLTLDPPPSMQYFSFRLITQLASTYKPLMCQKKGQEQDVVAQKIIFQIIPIIQISHSLARRTVQYGKSFRNWWK